MAVNVFYEESTTSLLHDPEGSIQVPTARHTESDITSRGRPRSGGGVRRRRASAPKQKRKDASDDGGEEDGCYINPDDLGKRLHCAECNKHVRVDANVLRAPTPIWEPGVYFCSEGCFCAHQYKARANTRDKVVRKDFELFLASQYGLSLSAASSLWSGLLDYIRQNLVAGHPVVFSELGTLAPYEKSAKRYKHPKTGKMKRSPKRMHVRFTLLPAFKALLRDD